MKIGKLTWKLVFGCIYCTVTKHHKTISLKTAHSVNMLGNNIASIVSFLYSLF